MEDFGINTELDRQTRPEIHQYNVCPVQQGFNDGSGICFAQFQRQAMLAAIAGNEDSRFEGRNFSHVAVWVAVGRFDFYDLRAPFCQQLAAKGHGHELAEFSDFDIFKRLRIGHGCELVRVSNLQQLFTDIFTGEKSVQSVGDILKALLNIFLMNQISGLDPTE